MPQICLVDPFPDPAAPDRLVTEGTVAREYTKKLIADFGQGCDVTLVGSRRLVERLFGGRLTPLVAHFAQNEVLTPDDIAEIEALLRELKQ